MSAPATDAVDLMEELIATLRRLGENPATWRSS
jgi:hypothetical protein